MPSPPGSGFARQCEADRLGELVHLRVAQAGSKRFDDGQSLGAPASGELFEQVFGEDH